MLQKIFPLLALSGLLFLFTNCKKTDAFFTEATPRQKYITGLKKSPLAENKNVRRWIAAGNKALTHSFPVSLPLKTKILYFIDEPNAHSWQFMLAAGRTLKAQIKTTNDSTRIFMGLFVRKNKKFTLVEVAGDTLIKFTLDNPQTLVLRVQPEMLTAGSAVLTITDQPSMVFPVKGGKMYDIGGGFGAPRDGGSRYHKGIDIFAERGTPVLAATDGKIIYVDTGGIGGRTVWLKAGGKSIYYAHLDSFGTREGQTVQAGEVIGFVGNSGNANSTPTHLHFGVYLFEATNPLPYVKFSYSDPEPITVNLKTYVKWGRVDMTQIKVYSLPSVKAKTITTLTRNDVVKVKGATKNYYWVKLPDGKKGFIYKKALTPADSSVETEIVSKKTLIFRSFASSKPLARLTEKKKVEIFGKFKNRRLVKYQNHRLWILNDHY